MKFRHFCIVLLLCLLAVAVFSGGFLSLNSANASGEEQQRDKGIPLVILMYHEISNRKVSDYILPIDTFESDLKFLQENGYTGIFMADLINYIENGTPLPKKPVMLTFDDGSRTDYKNAFPLLKKYNTKAVISVVGKYTDRAYDENGNENGVYTNSLTYAHMKEMLDSGLIEIQNHTYNLHSLSCRKGLKNNKGENLNEYEKLMTDDLGKVDAQLYKHLGIKPTTIAFPYGAYSKQTLEIIKRLGYKASLTCNEGVNYINKDTNLYLLKRYNRAPSRDIIKILSGI